MKLLVGNCIDVLSRGAAERVDAIVTDPPYGLGFMGKQWDGLPPGDEFAAQALRVLKPGGHLLGFGGTRTYHRLACALEDAGFEIRDCLAWMYGTGFPKSLDVSKAIDKAAGAEREVVGVYASPEGTSGASNHEPRIGTSERIGGLPAITAPATPDAERWQGWGTALKPAFEPIVLARKPLGERTVAANVRAHGTGALNIEGTRIEADPDRPRGLKVDGTRAQSRATGLADRPWMHGEQRIEPHSPAGRWPANVILDKEAAAQLDEQTGELVSGANPARRGADRDRTAYGEFAGDANPQRGRDVGSASRFFYVAKSSRKERTCGGTVENDHPTVKPVELMRWLVRLVTPPGGLVVDPFVGSGTTGIAAVLEGFDFVGIDQDPHYIDIARARIAAAQEEAVA